jgi:exosortase
MLPMIETSLWSRLTRRVSLRGRATAREAAFAENPSPPLVQWSGALDQKGLGVDSMALQIGVLLLLIGILYGGVLVSMANQWFSDPNYGHGVFVPLFAGYLLWRKRELLRGISSHPNSAGLAIMLAALALLILGTLGGEHFTTRFSLLVLIGGLVVFLLGWQSLRRVAFPLGYLMFMIPLPAIIYYQITFPLQLLASRLGAHGLVAAGVPTLREGNLLILPNCTLEVVEACSGVRSLLSLLAAVVGYAYLMEPSLWKRWALVALAVPVVILSNGLRLVATGLVSFHFGPQANSGIAHAAVGLAVFAVAFLFVVGTHVLLRRLKRKRISEALS